jgi:hypothetical protein
MLAHCVSLTANAVRTPRQGTDESEANTALLASEVGLDMTAYWQPTAASYFGRVSKERIVQAVREAVSVQAAENIASMKKQAMAEAAETAVAGKGVAHGACRMKAVRASRYREGRASGPLCVWGLIAMTGASCKAVFAFRARGPTAEARRRGTRFF